jgi:archaemetzincin
MSRLLFYLLILSLSACSNNDAGYLETNKTQHNIVLLPFKGTDSTIIKEIKSELQKRLLVKITIGPSAQLPSSAYYKKRQRYIADSLLVFLKDRKGNRFEKIIGVTASDISTKKESHANWGIMGLGYCPGKSCVISSYWVKRTSKNKQHYINRMVILAMHELGHTYSLPHCSNDPCIMRDADGKMNLDNGESYCNDCYSHLKRKGILQ